MSASEVPIRDRLFVGQDDQPYDFYLCPPLDTNNDLIQMVVEHGGSVVDDLSLECIVISSEGYDVPENLKDAHIYSYKAIEDSVANGIQMDFAHYLIHAPPPEPDFQQQEITAAEPQVEPKQNGSNNDNNDDEVNPFLDIDPEYPTEVPNSDPPPIGAESGLSADLPTVQQSKATAVFPKHHGVKYFTPEEDAFLLEEIRKRPWLGFKGHQIYKEICELSFFQKRERTSASLRERIRTLKYHVGYVYSADKDHKLLVDEDGKYVRSFLIKACVQPFTAADDFGLCKVVYGKLSPKPNSTGFETVYFPTNFFDKYGAMFPQHSPESWRQRFKNYLAIFGVANYLKYFIMEKQQGNDPLPSNSANRDWIKARRSLRKTDGPRLYFPNIPDEDQFIDDNIDTILVPELEGKNLDVFTPMAWTENKEDGNEAPPSKRQRVSNSTEPTAPESITRFVDTPTTYFREATFAKFYEKEGEPIDLDEVIPRKDSFLTDVANALKLEELTASNMLKALNKVGVKKYYAMFLIYRCGSKEWLVQKSIKRYVETNGQELLCISPGAWSNKAIDWLELKNKHLNDLLKAYHGEEDFNIQVAAFKKSHSINL
ncbi:hypothetical protein FOA43_003027 [Brettanomyces nanus]|uniref:DNA-binding protein RAP1 n=1 Tax=Eeniella nana TaxID=13502 RepID=A0A875S7I2_EENNA|nr:uncharacterized protein FOA43_003027 [Brettanomyces nanus]QPG75669.1 hypothetical protein FOA43_003027 [Brettanomyces nanus]